MLLDAKKQGAKANMRVSFTSKGSYKSTATWLGRLKDFRIMSLLDQCGREGVDALSKATPMDTGRTASCWDYEIEYSNSGGSIQAKIIWSNSNTIDTGQSIAFLLQYGHGTGTGGYVIGRDYINPAMRPVFDDISEKIRKYIQP